MIARARSTERSAGRHPKPLAPPLVCADWVEKLPADEGEGAMPFRRSSWFRLGDASLQVLADGDGFLEEFETHYRDCIVAPPRQGPVDVRCEASRIPGSSLLCLRFRAANLPDPIECASTPFRMLRHLARYLEVPGPAPGWRMLVDRQDGDRMLVAGDDHRLVIDLDVAPAEFASDSVVGLVQRAQPGVLFLHAASFGVGGAGALLVGCGRSGKSTTSLALAERGHLFLGDDVAAIRVRTRELLPFPKVMSLRPGPSGRSLQERLRATRHAEVVGQDGAARTLVSMGELLPASAGRVLPLRFAFLLDGFGTHPGLRPFRPQIADARRLKAVVSESIPSWGLSPGRDLMRFLAVVNVLSGVDCHLVELGSPEDSAAAIEHVMEAPCHST